MFTDALGMQPHSVPRALNAADIAQAVKEHVASAKLVLDAGFDGLFILSGGFDHASAEQALLDQRGDLIAFGRPFLANPDLVARLRRRFHVHRVSGHGQSTRQLRRTAHHML